MSATRSCSLCRQPKPIPRTSSRSCGSCFWRQPKALLILGDADSATFAALDSEALPGADCHRNGRPHSRSSFRSSPGAVKNALAAAGVDLATLRRAHRSAGLTGASQP